MKITAITAITGVPGVRIAQISKTQWVVQAFLLQKWTSVSEPYESEEAALDAAPVICEF